jgi:CubicO group peptidase (beta-lactamase class C family)
MAKEWCGLMASRRQLVPVALAVLGCALSATIARAQTTLDVGALDRVVEQELRDTGTPGAAIAIVSGDRVVFSKGYGVASVETREPVRPEMLFRLGSTTKMFTAAALVLLAERNGVNLNAPIGSYVTGLHPTIAALTAHQLLSHTSGLLDEAPMFGSDDEAALEKEVRSWTDTRFFTEPGQIYSYSNPGYWLAGFLVERLGGKRYADQLEASLFQPLGMSRTTFRPLVAITHPLAQGHDATPAVIRPIANNAASWPAGSMFSSVQDLSRFVIAFMNNGKLGTEQVLPRSLISTLSHGNVAVPGGRGTYTYGLELSKVRGVDVVSHGGSRSGYGSQITMVPAHRFGVMVTANRTGASLPRTVEKAMELSLPLEAARPTAATTMVAFTPAEMKALAGTYSQALRTIVIEMRGGKLMVTQDGREVALEKVAANDFRFGGTRLIAVTRGDGAVAYIHSGGRSWKKVS